MRSIFPLIPLFYLATIVLTSCGAQKYAMRGDEFLSRGEFFAAAEQYKKAYRHTPPKERETRGLLAKKMGMCYGRIQYNARALSAYQNALRYHSGDSLTLLRVAQMQHRLGQYKAAYKSYEAFLENIPGHPLGINGLNGVIQAERWKKHPTNYLVRRDPLFNARRSDFCPVLQGDNWDLLYLTSTRPQALGNDLSGITGTKHSDIFMSRKDEKGLWGPVTHIESEINSEFDEGTCAFTPDGQTMFLTRCVSDPTYARFAQIFQSKRSDAAWSKPTPIEISGDTLSCYAHPAVSPDGKWLYFVSDMPGGIGGKDIWRYSLFDSGASGIENLGKEINTPGDEMFPSFRPNGELYFSSDGHPGMGGLDLFCAKQDSTGMWHIENLGSPMNSAGDDFGMTFEGVHNRGFFSSNRNDARGWDHIYSFSKPEIIQTVKGWVYEKDGYELPQGLVYMVGDDGTNKRISLRADGSFEEVVQPNVHYVLLGTCRGYLNHKQELCVDTSSTSREYVLQFPLANINVPVLVRNVFYEFDRAEITPNSSLALDSLAELLTQNPNVTIELSSHCDFRGSDSYNLLLSQRRAESVVRYLINKGIARDRLTPVGYGEKRPKIVSRKINEQYPFLAQGDTLSESYIKNLTQAEQQEICHSLNRRTEFKVLRTTYGLFESPNTMATKRQDE